MIKLIISIFVVCLIFVLALGGYLYINSSDSLDDSGVPTGVQNKISDCREGRQIDVQSCILALAASDDVLVCEEASDAIDCYGFVALKNSDYKICYNINHLALQEECVLIYISSNRDFSFCDELKSDSAKDQCYFLKAGMGNDPDACNKIKEENLRNECLPIFNP